MSKALDTLPPWFPLQPYEVGTINVPVFTTEGPESHKVEVAQLRIMSEILSTVCFFPHIFGWYIIVVLNDGICCYPVWSAFIGNSRVASFMCCLQLLCCWVAACNRDHTWLSNPKIFVIWPFKEQVCWPLLQKVCGTASLSLEIRLNWAGVLAPGLISLVTKTGGQLNKPSLSGY